MARVEALDEPLRTEADCDRVRGDGVGKDNVEKLKEIVRTGTFRRNETLARDPHHQAIKLVRPLHSMIAGLPMMAMCRSPLGVAWVPPAVPECAYLYSSLLIRPVLKWKSLAKGL